jgi:glycerophosphoryl diester phosphodiesterase
MTIATDHWLVSRAVAHRGYHSGTEIPENSLASFQKAIDRGLPIELDVQLMGEDTALVFHDKTTKRLCGEDYSVKILSEANRKKLRLYDTDEIVPTLQEVLEFVNEQVPILLEIKSDTKDWLVESAISKALIHYKGEVAIQSFNPYSLMWLRENHPHILLGLLGMRPEHYKISKFMDQVLGNYLMSPQVQPDFYGYDMNDIDHPMIQFWRVTRKVPLLAWTVSSDQDWEKIRHCVDNIIFENIDINYSK